MKGVKKVDVDSMEVIRVKLLDGSVVQVPRGKIIGFCHNLIHPGKMTKTTLEKHRCLAKQCPFLERYEDAPFWAARKVKEAAKQSAKQYKKEKKAILFAEMESMAALRSDFQKYADATNSEIEIVRVEHPNFYSYVVFYVSDNRFDDADRFHRFLNAARAGYNWMRVFLRHIKDVDGHFVTRKEYHARKR